MAKSIDWTRLGWCMTQAVKVGSESTSMFANGKARFGAFKAASDQILGKHTIAAARPKAVNFAHYRSALPAQAEWVDSMEKQYATALAAVPKPGDAGLGAVVAADDSVFEEIVASSTAALDSAATDAQGELNKLSGLPPPLQMTDSDVYAVFPELNPHTAEQQQAHHGDPCHRTEEQIEAIESDYSARRQKVKHLYYN